MSESTRRAEHRRLRKAVGDDAMKLMAAMSGILDDEIRPTQALMGDTIRTLATKVTTLEGLVVAQAKQIAALERSSPAELIGEARARLGLTNQRTGAEVV